MRVEGASDAGTSGPMKGQAMDRLGMIINIGFALMLVVGVTVLMVL